MIYEGKCTVIGIIITGKIMLTVCSTSTSVHDRVINIGH